MESSDSYSDSDSCCSSGSTVTVNFEDDTESEESVYYDQGPFPLNLYEESGYPDNYTDPQYLSAMKLNPNASKSYTFKNTFVLSTRIVLQLSAAVVFFIVYYHMRQETLAASATLIGALISTSIGYFILNILPKMRDLRNRNIRGFLRCFPREHVKVTIIYFLIAYQLAPVMRTLTFTVSTDTIHATALFTIVVHLFTCNYGTPGFLRSKTISANVAIIGSICLASRMTTDSHSMALLTFAIQVFILFPIFCPCIWNSTTSLVLSIFIVSICCYWTVSATLFLVFISTVFMVVVAIPTVFVACIHYKNNIYGPWDEALMLKRIESSQQLIFE